MGGGYPDDGLAHVSFWWMMEEARRCGLSLWLPEYQLKLSMVDPGGRLYDSRDGLRRFYRYGPRKVLDLCQRQLSSRQNDKVQVAFPKIHASVFDRMTLFPDQYLPLGLPEKYEVVAHGGKIESSELFEPEASSRAQYQERVWDVIWWRKIVNYTIITLSVFLFTYPFLLSFPRSLEFPTSLRFVSDLLRVSRDVLPHIFSMWLNEYARNPLVFLVVLSGVACLASFGATLKSKIIDEIRVAWLYPMAPGSYPQKDSLTFRLRTNPLYLTIAHVMRFRIAPLFYAALCGLLFLYLGTTIVNRAVFLYEDAAGYFCRGESSVTLETIPRGEQRSFSLPARGFCFATGILLEEIQSYLLAFEQVNPGRSDESVFATKAGYATDQFPGWRPLFAQPFKRIWGCPFFRMIAQIGTSGNELRCLAPRPSESGSGATAMIRPRKSGQLFLYLNDIALAVPSLAGIFYTSNSTGSGTMVIEVRRP